MNKPNLQGTLAASTADSALAGEIEGKHYPITCVTGPLYFYEDHTFACEHATAPPDNIRTQAALDAMAAILIMEQINVLGL